MSSAKPKAADKQLFAPVPLRAMALDLSGLQLRVTICVASHDRLSLVTGKGQGCRASNERMAQMVGCNYSNLCSTLTSLVELEILQKEKLGRHTVYRVIYTDDDRLLFSNLSRPLIGCQAASDDPSIGCRDVPEYPDFPPENDSQYIPLNGGRDSVETGEENSSEDARLTSRREVDKILKGLRAEKDSRPKGRLSRTEFAENVGGQMAWLERALNDGEPINKLDWYEWLGDHAVCHENRSLGGQAMRLAELLVEAMDETEHQQWQDRYGPASLAAA
jgi:hypothetical protein